MHVLHYIAVEAEDKKDAFHTVKNFLEEPGNCSWSDWHVVGGGRWSKHSREAIEDSIEDIISYKDDSNTFIKAIEGCRDSRKEEMSSMLQSLNKSGGEAEFIIRALEYSKTGDSIRLDMNCYYFSSIAEMLLGEWKSKSYFYDLASHTSSFIDVKDRINTNPEAQYLVPVDFHF
jgi:hypothetical protein